MEDAERQQLQDQIVSRVTEIAQLKQTFNTFVRCIFDAKSGSHEPPNSCSARSLYLTDPAANLQTIIVISDSSALQTWRKTHFNIYNPTGNAANNADANGNGLPDLTEYVMGQNLVIFCVAGSRAAVGLTRGGICFPMPADLRSFGWLLGSCLGGQVLGINLRQC